jgi:hypothetical protein
VSFAATSSASPQRWARTTTGESPAHDAAVASHILLAQQGIRALRPADHPYFTGGSWLSDRRRDLSVFGPQGDDFVRCVRAVSARSLVRVPEWNLKRVYEGVHDDVQCARRFIRIDYDRCLRRAGSTRAPG